MRMSVRRKEEDWHLNSGCMSPSELHSLKSLDFCDTPELELYSSTPKVPRSAHKRKNKSKKLRQHKSSAKEPMSYTHNGLMNSVLDSETESTETCRFSNGYGQSKMFTKTRNSERNLKQLNNHGRFLDATESGSGASSLPPIVVTSQKYKCLDSMPVSKSINELDFSLKTCPPRFNNSPPPLFGSDRVNFYKNFSLLIDLGKSRDKDLKRHSCNRQMSTEEELWRSQFGDVIWLELQAHLNQMLPSQQDIHFMKCRENIPKMIDEMLLFRVSPNASEMSSIHSLNHNVLESCTCDGISDDPIPSARDMFGTCPGKVLKLFHEASQQTKTMISWLDYIESLYPTRKALLKGCPAYGIEELQRRISALYLWCNISRDLFQQLKSILDLVMFSKHKECSLWSCIEPSNIVYILQSLGRPIRKMKDYIPGFQSGNNGSVLSLFTPENIEDVKMEDESGDADDGKDDFTDEDEADGEDDDEEEDDGGDDESVENDVDYRKKVVSFIEYNGSEGFQENRLLSKSSITSAYSFEAIPASTTSFYRHYVDRNLKRTGMRKFCNRLRQMVDKTLSKSQQALESVMQSENNRGGKTINAYMEEMGLPSFICIYHFLCHVPLDIIHECLKLRLERQPKREPSIYILKTLIQECKDILSSVIDWKHYYLKLISTIKCTGVHEAEMDKLEDDLMKMLQVYFNHMQQFMKELQQLPEMSKELKNFLEKEWNFMKICCYIKNGEAYAGNKFCAMASSLIQSISNFLDGKIDECINQLSSSLESPNSGEPSRSRSSEFRQSMLQIGRDLKLHFNEARERSYKAVAFAKMLKKDLEVAALYGITAPVKVVLEYLRTSDHVQIVLPETTNYLIFASRSMSTNKSCIQHLLNVSYEWEEPNQNGGEFPCYIVLSRVDKYDPLAWKGDRVIVNGTADILNSLVYFEVNGWLLLALHSFQLGACRKVFGESLGSHLELINEQMSCRQDISKSLNELKNRALDLRVRIVEGLSHIIDRLYDAELVDLEESEKNNVLKSNKETINYCFTFAFEYHKELLRLISSDMKGDLSRVMIDFARQWMKFAQSCDRGRGVKPRWASHGFEFLKISCEPKNLNYLNDDEFNTLTNDINCCISHVIGTKPTGCSPDVVHNKSLLKGFSLSSRRSYASPSRSVSCNSSNSSNVISNASSYSTLKTSLMDLSSDELQEGIFAQRRNSRSIRGTGVMTAINELDRERNQALIRNKVIGRVSDAKPDVDGAVRMRRVKFKWQRGIKIGEGQFGKVYIAINLDNDVLMAMKEIKLQPNDHQAIRKIDEEIKTFEGIKHKSLVQYFGVELYRDEMIIFMEYCQNGTIEDLAKQGLDEHMIRKYSNEILQAIYVLHCHDIVHRDIKGANIFLMPNNSIKLGDFGCSVKLKSHTTMAGELNEYVGTPAFMAPEVIKGDALKGYGRAADIWSFGCVIIQMTTGKRPWPELESKIQIFFKVGSGAVPQIPEILSEEGKEFLSHCLEPDDEKRWTAEQLIDHPFIKISEDDDLET